MISNHFLPAAVLILALVASPSDAADSMASSSMMSTDAMSNDAMASNSAMGGDAMAMSGGAMMATMGSGEVIAIMPGGQMGTLLMTGDKMNMTIGMSAALDHCVMFITGANGKTYQVDTTSAAAQKECEGIAK